MATAQLNGQFPGATVSLPGDELVPLRVDWRSSWSAVGDTVENDASDVGDDEFDIIPGVGEESIPFSGEVPDRIVVVTGERDGCGWDRFHCADSVGRRVIDIDGGATTAPGVTLMATDGIAEVMIDPPADGYVRVELFWDVDIDGADSANGDSDHDDGDEPRFLEGRNYDFAAYTSPIYVERTSTATIVGQVVDGPTGQPVGGAAVELCRTDNSPVCVTRTTRARRHVRAGRLTRRDVDGTRLPARRRDRSRDRDGRRRDPRSRGDRIGDADPAVPSGAATVAVHRPVGLGRRHVWQAGRRRDGRAVGGGGHRRAVRTASRRLGRDVAVEPGQSGRDRRRRGVRLGRPRRLVRGQRDEVGLPCPRR